MVWDLTEEIVILDLKLLLEVVVEVSKTKTDILVDLVEVMELMEMDITNQVAVEQVDKETVVVEVHPHRTELLVEEVVLLNQVRMDIIDQTPDLQEVGMDTQLTFQVHP
tara:strand:- start:266 stop:592 length:327 start_codon:yes stop_codon:yes gene_type:complete